MFKVVDILLLGFCSLSSVGASRLTPQENSVPLDLTSYFNNKGFGTYPGEASLDGANESYPDPGFSSPFYTSTATGIVFSFPGYTGPRASDNVICSGQTISISNTTSTSFFSASFLVASDKNGATVSGNVTFSYTDGSTSVFELRATNWWSFLTIDRGEIVLPYRFTADGVNGNTSHVFERTAALSPGKTLKSITLPVEDNVDDGRLHIFAVSLWAGAAPGVVVQSVRPTQKWIKDSVQVVEVTLNNAGSECVSGAGLSVSLRGDGFTTVEPGTIKRLCPGDQKIASVGVVGASNGSITTTAHADVDLARGFNVAATASTCSFPNITIGLQNYTSDPSSLSLHEAPDWFSDAKFGIFIHWGPYAVTGWGNSSPYESYAEWFWWYSTHHPQADKSDFYDYRLRTFGADWAYDDTFPNFTASSFDPKAWVDLFAAAGAKYFVLTTKHHDGFALFDTGATTNRSALHYGPQRDIVRELFDAAAEYQPTMKRGTYFSLPEWFNPDFGPYGFDQSSSASTVSWPGIEAKNPYTNATEPYTGRVPISDFVADLMVPQMETLAYTYETDIMWCDCGAANGTADFAAAWWNSARATAGRQVAINSRCGIPQAADFDTPEYATFASAQARKWESNRGMDPYSYGYNRATPDGAYMNASAIVYSFVDIVSKNGNFLLDVGPRADGTIVEAEQANLREAGEWINGHAEAVFNTTYWFVQTEIADGKVDVRFTQTDGAFYVLFLEVPVVVDGVVEVAAPVPILEGDVVSLLAVEGGESLGWSLEGTGDDAVLKIVVPEALLALEAFCWVFKITYA